MRYVCLLVWISLVLILPTLVAQDGMVFVNSGCSFMPGNVLLAFSVQGKEPPR